MPNKIQKGFVYLKNRGVKEFAARAAEKAADARFDYRKWADAQRLTPLKAGYQRTVRMEEMPTVWVMILRQEGEKDPFHEDLFQRTVQSVKNQTYPKKEICEVLTTRIADEDLVTFARPGDLLAEDALYEVVKASQGGVFCVYTDEDGFRAEETSEEKPARQHGRGESFGQPLFKPAYNPDYLRSMNYIGSLFSARAGILRKAAQESGKDDFASAWNLSPKAAYYEMILLCTDLARGRIMHVPRVLYHRHHQKHKAETQETEEIREVLKQDLLRHGEDGIVEYGPSDGTFHVRYLPRGNPLVSIVIPNRDHVSLLKSCLDSIRERTTWENLDIVVVENNSVQKETFDFYESLRTSPYRSLHVKVAASRQKRFDFSELVNEGAREAQGDYLILLNNDVTVKSPDWIERLLGQCQRRGVGAAGPRLLYPDGTVQSAGIVAGIMGFAGSMMVGERAEDPGYMSRSVVSQDMSAVTAACMMVKKKAYFQAGGFSRDLAVALNDVDFCLRLNQAGYRVVFDPSAEMIHHESKSRGYEDTREKKERFEREKKIFRKRWKILLKEGDPCYNPNLSLRKCDYSQSGRMSAGTGLRWQARGSGQDSRKPGFVRT